MDVKKDINKNVSAVDLAKFLFSIAVVMIHTGLFKDASFYNQILNYYLAIAVPFFFVASGFFLGKKLNSSLNLNDYREKIKNYIKRLLVPYLIWGVLNFLIEIALKIYSGEKVLDAILYNIHNWLVSSPGGGLWYVQAVIIMSLILLLSSSKRLRYILLILLFITNLFPPLFRDMMSDNFYVKRLLDLYYEVFLSERNFILSGGVCFIIGIVLEDIYKKINIKQIRVLLCISLLIYIVSCEIDIFGMSIIRTSVRPIFTALLFLTFLTVKMPYSYKSSLIMRQLSTIIYFTHMLVRFFVLFGLKLLGYENQILLFIGTISVIFIYSVLLYKTKAGLKVKNIIY